jgi:hypothetical protein
MIAQTAQPPDLPPGAQLVTLEPVYVSSKHIGAMMAAFRRHDIYFQFGPRRGDETVFFVLPTDREFAEHLAVTVCGPLVGTGCNFRLLLLLGLPLALFIALAALMSSMAGL